MYHARRMPMGEGKTRRQSERRGRRLAAALSLGAGVFVLFPSSLRAEEPSVPKPVVASFASPPVTLSWTIGQSIPAWSPGRMGVSQGARDPQVMQPSLDLKKPWVAPPFDPRTDPYLRAMLPTPTPTPVKEGLHHKLWFVTLELFAVQTASILIFAAMPQDVSGFENPNVGNIFRFAAEGPHFDNDRWGFNYIGHPLSGSEYYLIARNRGATWWQGFLYSFGWSAFWEYVTEGLYERASIQDLIVTPVGGTLLGELRYQVRRSLLNPRTGKADNLALQIVVIALDPVQAISEAIPLDF